MATLSASRSLPPIYYTSGKPLIGAASKKTMSATQTYILAHKARAKLSCEAAQPDHDLRLLVGHANLLDSLMIELADAEQEQQRRYHQWARASTPKSGRRIQWIDRVTELPQDDDGSDSSSSDSESDCDEEPDVAQLARVSSISRIIVTNSKSDSQTVRPRVYQDGDEDQDDAMDDVLEDDYSQLELVRSPSHANSPPGLADCDSDSSDDEPMPPLFADTSLPFSDKQDRDRHTEAEREALYEEGYYTLRRNSNNVLTPISAY